MKVTNNVQMMSFGNSGVKRSLQKFFPGLQFVKCREIVKDGAKAYEISIPVLSCDNTGKIITKWKTEIRFASEGIGIIKEYVIQQDKLAYLAHMRQSELSRGIHIANAKLVNT